MFLFTKKHERYGQLDNVEIKTQKFIVVVEKDVSKVAVATFRLLLHILLFNHETKPNGKDLSLKYFIFITICNGMDIRNGT